MNMDSITELEDLTGLINDLLEDSTVWCQLEWDMPESDETFTLAQFSGDFDLCDVVLNELEQESALEFLFYPSSDAEEIPSLVLPIDPDDVEVNILDDGLEMQSLDFYLVITITNRTPRA